MLICDLPDGGRCYALLDGGAAVLAGTEADELIGRQCHPHAGRRDQPRRTRLRPGGCRPRWSPAQIVAGIDGCPGRLGRRHAHPRHRTTGGRARSSPISMPSSPGSTQASSPPAPSTSRSAWRPGAPRRADIEARRSGAAAQLGLPRPGAVRPRRDQLRGGLRPLAGRLRQGDLKTTLQHPAEDPRSRCASVTPRRQRRLFEMCPELSLAIMAGAPMTHAKTTAAGRAERLHALGAVVRRVTRSSATRGPCRERPSDDVSTPSPARGPPGVHAPPDTCSSAADVDERGCAWRWSPDRRTQPAGWGRSTSASRPVAARAHSAAPARNRGTASPAWRA